MTEKENTNEKNLSLLDALNSHSEKDKKVLQAVHAVTWEVLTLRGDPKDHPEEGLFFLCGSVAGLACALEKLQNRVTELETINGPLDTKEAPKENPSSMQLRHDN